MFIVSCQGKICPLHSHHGGILEEKGKRLVVLGQGNSLSSLVPSFLEEWQWMPWREHEARAMQYLPRALSSSQQLAFQVPWIRNSVLAFNVLYWMPCSTAWGNGEKLPPTCLQVGGRKQEQREHFLSITQPTGSWTFTDTRKNCMLWHSPRPVGFVECHGLLEW